MSSFLPSTSSIVFFDPDSETARDALGNALRALPQEMLVLGLIVKVERKADEEKIVNWEFATPETVKSLALVLTGEMSPSSNKE